MYHCCCSVKILNEWRVRGETLARRLGLKATVYFIDIHDSSCSTRSQMSSTYLVCEGTNGGAEGPCQPEVGDLELAIAAHQQVLRLEISAGRGGRDGQTTPRRVLNKKSRAKKRWQYRLKKKNHSKKVHFSRKNACLKKKKHGTKI